MNARRHAEMLRCQQFLLDRLRRQMRRRPEHDDWIERERLTLAIAAHQWGTAHGLAKAITVAEVERLEQPAVGHVDYAEKVCLYVAEFMYGARAIRP